MSLSETRPGAGPPLHLHTTEAAHVLLHGSLDYIFGDRLFSVSGPTVVRIPAAIPHTFANSGAEALNLIAVFPSSEVNTTTLGPNPLIITSGRLKLMSPRA